MRNSGISGVLASNGYWFNLDTYEWKKRATVPHRPISELPTPLYSFRNKPTFFGNQDCDNEGYCEFTKVIQYDPIRNNWEQIGSLNRGRTRQEVIMVPSSFCDGLEAPPTSEPTMTPPPTDAPSVTPQPPAALDTVAMIVGGYAVGEEGDQFVELDTVELFGCDGPSREIANLPIGMYQFSGAFVHDESSDRVLVCGGYQCKNDDLNCADLSDTCYEWRPNQNEWIQVPSLVSPRRTHATVQVIQIICAGS